MGKQLGFLMDADTERSFADYVLEEGVIVHQPNNKNQIFIKELPKPFSDIGWFSLLLYKPQFGMYTLNKANCIDPILSPVIEFCRTIILHEEKRIAFGRLWLEVNYYQNDRLVEKDPALYEWYKSLTKWIRKNIPKQELAIGGRVRREHITHSVKQIIEKDNYFVRY